MGARQRAWAAAVRWRYVLLAGWAAAWFVPALRASRGMTDWLYFSYGSRVLAGWDGVYGVGALHLYARHPEVQIGPPPLALVAAFQWAPVRVVPAVFAVVMAAAVLVVLRAVEVAGHSLRHPALQRRTAALVLLGGLVVVPFWCVDVATYRHLDDVLAAVAVTLAVALVARRSPHAWWVAGLLLGLAVATKPWALGVTPLLLALPRPRRAPAALVAIGSAATCWLPFVLGDARTLTALGSYRLYVDDRSVLALLGVDLDAMAPSWVRPVQLLGGFLLAVVVARHGRWTAIPLVTVAVRLGIDPQVWPYYGMAALAFAVLVDATDPRRGWPRWTVWTAACLYLLPWLTDAAVAPARLVWAASVVLLASGLVRRSLPPRRPVPDGPEDAVLVGSV